MASTDWLWVVGTGAELIKCAPVIRWLRQAKAHVRVLCTGQHDLRGHLCWAWIDLPPAHIQHLPHQAHGQGRVWSLLQWWGRHMLRSTLQVNQLLKPSLGTVVLVHGDTLSTVVGAYWAQRLGLPLVHLEAGLRSFSRLRPFPEEWSRQLVGLISDVAICGSEFAATNQRHHLLGLGSSKPGQQVVLLPGNTLQDSVRAAQLGELDSVPSSQQLALPWLPKQPYVLWTLHRQELLWDKQRLTALVHALVAITQQHSALLVGIVHAQTKHRLQALQLWDMLERADNMLLLPIQPFPQFIYLLQHATGLLSDGGSNQEEASYLACPHLILRSETERLEGLGRTARLWRGVADVPLFVQQVLQAPAREPRLLDSGPAAAIGQWLLDWRERLLRRDAVASLPHVQAPQQLANRG